MMEKTWEIKTHMVMEVATIMVAVATMVATIAATTAATTTMAMADHLTDTVDHLMVETTATPQLLATVVMVDHLTVEVMVDHHTVVVLDNIAKIDQHLLASKLDHKLFNSREKYIVIPKSNSKTVKSKKKLTWLNTPIVLVISKPLE